MMDVNALLQALGYLLPGRHWVTIANADSRLDGYYHQAQRAAEDAGDGARVVGSYVYQTSMDDRTTPPRPAVFVAQANTVEAAREIHRNFWNLGDCPFVIVVLPTSVRVYSGFEYTRGEPKRGLIADHRFGASGGLFTDEALPKTLRAFHADAIDSGQMWEEQAKHLGSTTRVDFHLLTNLKGLSRQLQDRYSLTRAVAHALIGKYIYFRYLRDRDILDDDWLTMRRIQPDTVFGRLATADGFAALAEALQAQFNGTIFPLPVSDDGRWRTNGAVPFLAATFQGDTHDGQLTLDFGSYDFAYIPIELLSSIYEQFLKEDSDDTSKGVVYTPEALADYMLAEMEAVHPLQLGHRVLDPCCGSGVFLVLVYRRLIEKLRQEQKTRPTAEELKRLLQTCIYGVEKDLEACQITAFSLILTLLSQLEPPELRANADFQFPNLIDENIYPADFFDPDCPVFQSELRFDWIVGNPPWITVSAKQPDDSLALDRLKRAQQRGLAVGERRLDEAFLWRAAELLHANGYAGLLIKATTLVNSSSSAFREAFFKRQEVRHVTNLTHLQEILFTGPDKKRARAPAALLVYRNAILGTVRPDILHFGPFVVHQMPVHATARQRRAWMLTLYESDMQVIDATEAAHDTAFLWKTALWGSYVDRRALSRLARFLPDTLGRIAQKKGWVLCSGPHVKSSDKQKLKGYFVPTGALRDRHILDSQHLNSRFYVDQEALPLLPPERRFIRQRTGSQGLKLIPAPHVAIASDVALYSDLDFVIAAPKIGIAAEKHDADYLKAVALYLNSSIARYATFFNSALLGIFIETLGPEDIKAIPFVDLTSEQISTLALVYDRLAEHERLSLAEHAPLQGAPVDYQQEVDQVVEATLGIPASIGMIAREFMQVRHQLNRGRTPETALKPPSMAALQLYAEQLRQQVDGFARRHHRVSLAAGPTAIIATVEVTDASEPLPVEISQEWDAPLNRIWHAANEQHSQWAYIQRSVRVFDGPCVHIIKAARLLDWTRTQAIQDASDLIAEVLDKTTPRHDQATA